MRFTQFHSLPPAFAFAALAFTHVLAEAAPFGQVIPEVITIENQKMFISDGVRMVDGMWDLAHQFLSLDLSTAWTSDAPAWKNLTRRPTGPLELQGSTALTKDQESILFFTNTTTYKYNIKTDAWDKEPYMNMTYPGFVAVVTDTDSGLIYGMEHFRVFEVDPDPNSWKFTTLDPATKNFTSVDIQGHQDEDVRTLMVYSSASKTIFGYEDGFSSKPSTLLSYNTASKSWSPVNTTGDIPPTRQIPCFVSAYGGKKLIMAGGTDPKRGIDYQDVYIYDVATSVWTRLADAPRLAWGAVCGASGDSLILWGGSRSVNGTEVSYDEGPVILNIASNTWGNKYYPSGQAPKSSADRAALSKIGLVALTLMSVAASSLVL